LNTKICEDRITFCYQSYVFVNEVKSPNIEGSVVNG